MFTPKGPKVPLWTQLADPVIYTSKPTLAHRLEKPEPKAETVVTLVSTCFGWEPKVPVPVPGGLDLLAAWRQLVGGNLDLKE